MFLLKKWKELRARISGTPRNIDIVVLGCRYVHASRDRSASSGEFDVLDNVIQEFLRESRFQPSGGPIVARDGTGYALSWTGSCDDAREAAGLQRKLTTIMERHGLLTVKEGDSALDGFDQTPEPVRLLAEGLSTHWRCPRCHQVYLKKGNVEFEAFLLKAGGKVEGTAKCMSCGHVVAAKDLALGTYDESP